MMCISASFKLTYHPAAVQAIHQVVGVPLNLLPVLAALEIAGGLGLVVGIFRPKIGVAAGIGLVCYFVGALIAHVRVSDWVGIKAPITYYPKGATHTWLAGASFYTLAEGGTKLVDWFTAIVNGTGATHVGM